MQYLILGHTGFIGRSLTTQLSKNDPEAEWRGLSLEDADLTSGKAYESLSEAMSRNSIVIVLVGIKRQIGEGYDTFEANNRIAINVCKAIAEAPVKRLVFMSSAAVYGEDVAHDVITEQTPLHPRTYYGLAKYNAEWLLRAAVNAGGAQSLCIIRPPTIYGPGDTSHSYGAPLFVERALNGEVITLWGDGSELREFVYIEDAVRAITAISASHYDGVVNLASGQSYTFKDHIDAVRHAAGLELAFESRPRSKDKVDHRFDNSCLQQILPDFEFLSLSGGVKALYQFAKDQKKESR